ncbi:MAG: DNA replication and repair protein RecF, partial [Actinomycetota bacterium]
VGADDPIDELLAEALVRTRRAEIDRGLTLVGPHRDEWRLVIGGLDSRYQASQGEQRTLALALRLAGHRVVAEVTGAAPVLLLDDVFSELDPLRSAALVRELPTGQTLLTTAGAVPDAVVPERRLRVSAGCVEVLAG